LIDDNGVARLDLGPQPMGDKYNDRDSALETWLSGDHITYSCMEKDMYGMSMVIYEVGFLRRGAMPNLTFFQVLSGSIPDSWGDDDDVALAAIQAGITPQRPSNGTIDPVWQFLEECWSEYPSERPSAADVYNTFSELHTITQLPEELRLQVQSIKFSFTGAKKQQFYVKFKYGNKIHLTSLTTRAVAGNEYTWFAFCPSLPPLLSLNPRQGLSGSMCDRTR